MKSAKNLQYVPLLTRSESSSSSTPRSGSPDINYDSDISDDTDNGIHDNKQHGRSECTKNDDKTSITDNRVFQTNIDDISTDDHITILRDCADDETTLYSTTFLSPARSVKDDHHYKKKTNNSTSPKSTKSQQHKATLVKLARNDSCKSGSNYNGKSDSEKCQSFFKCLAQPFRLCRSSSRDIRSQYSYHQHLSNSEHHRRNNMGRISLTKLFDLIFQRAVLAIVGAVLIHITLGTIYTLSNVNSYMTSYMKLHSDPSATYGGSIWITSMNAVGQGFAMIMGGFIEKRFSARVSCFIGCTIHSVSIASTRWSVEYGFAPVVITYGLLPGLGTGLAYITPITNGFGWFPNRKGLVAGVILAGYGIGTFIFNMLQTAFVNPKNLSPSSDCNPDQTCYFGQTQILENVPLLFTFLGSIYATLQFVGCCLLFKPPQQYGKSESDEQPIFDNDFSVVKAIKSQEFLVMYLVYGVTTQGVLFMNSMSKEYGQRYIKDDMYLAWTGSLASVANCLGRLSWGMTVDRFNFTICFTIITVIFGSLMFLLPFGFILSSKLLYLICTLGIFGSFSGWFAIYPVHCARVFGRKNGGIIYGLLFTSQSFGGILMAFIFRHLIDNYNRYVPCFIVSLMEAFGLSIYHLFYPHVTNV